MHTFLFVIIVYGGLGLISANIPSSIIDSDLAEMIKLSQAYKAASPQIAREYIETTCQMISQCCPQIKSNFVSIASSGNTQGLGEKCFGEKTSSNYFLRVLSCSPLMKMTRMLTDLHLVQYVSIITNKSLEDPNTKIMYDTCSEEEIYSYACDWNISDLQNTCQRKVLGKLAEQGDEIYHGQVQKSKDRYIKLTEALKKII